MMSNNWIIGLCCFGSFGLILACLPNLMTPTQDYLNEQLQLVTEATSEPSDDFYFLLQPSDCTTVDQGTATFSCMTNSSDVSYRWQSYTPSSGAWNDSIINDSAYSPTLSFTAYTFRNGYMYRCVATNNQTGQRIVSNTATLWVESDSKSVLPIYDPINDPFIYGSDKKDVFIDSEVITDDDVLEEKEEPSS